MTREAGPGRLGRLMSILSIPMLLAPIGGPILGGWLIDTSSWRWIFLINLPIGLLTLLLAAVVFRRDHPARSETFDVVGALLLSPGLAAFLFSLSSIPARGAVADRHVLIPAIAGLVLIVAFVLHALHRADHPLIDLRLFQNLSLIHIFNTLTTSTSRACPPCWTATPMPPCTPMPRPPSNSVRGAKPVSYTHLDVYKRQEQAQPIVRGTR